MKSLELLIEEYRAVPGAHITSFVTGIASVAEWLAGYAEQSWPEMLNSMMVEVGEYRPDKKADNVGSSQVMREALEQIAHDPHDAQRRAEDALSTENS